MRRWLLVLAFTLMLVAVLDKNLHNWRPVCRDTHGARYWVDVRSLRYPDRTHARCLLLRQDPDGTRHYRHFELDFELHSLRPLDSSQPDIITTGSVAERLQRVIGRPWR